MFSEDDLYREFYEQTMRVLEIRTGAPDFNMREIENELEALYIYQGQDWTGRGAVKDIEIEAQIAAYQVTLHALKGKPRE